MESKIIQIQEISISELSSLIKVSVREEISNLNVTSLNMKIEEAEELLTRKQVLELLTISSVTLWKWQKKGRITTYGISGKRYFKRSEIMDCLTKLKQ